MVKCSESIEKSKKNPATTRVAGLAADEGFEPSQTESESGVLPLHKSAKRKSYYTAKYTFVKPYFSKITLAVFV